MEALWVFFFFGEILKIEKCNLSFKGIMVSIQYMYVRFGTLQWGPSQAIARRSHCIRRMQSKFHIGFPVPCMQKNLKISGVQMVAPIVFFFQELTSARKL